MRRRPPHILVTTPESLYILLGSGSGRAMLATTRTVIVDEIHAMAANKRGAHLALSLERLTALCGDDLVRIGLSATQNPIDAIAHLLVGAAPDGTPAAEVTIVDTGHQRPRDLMLEVPDSPLEAVMSAEVWQQVYDRLVRLIEAHRTTLVFVNTRRMAERVARQLSDRLGEAAVTAHHGSMAKEQRLAAEQRLKHGELKALVATASLELGIDIGDVDLVCQLGSPRSIASFLQRVGRSGHAVGGLPKGRLFPQSRDDLVECAALLDSVRRGELDRLTIPNQPLDVLAQQIVAEVAAQDWPEAALYDRLRRAWPYRGSDARRIHDRRAHAGRGVRDQPRAARHAAPSRRHQPHAARPAWRATDRADLRRHDSGHRRLPGRAGTREPHDRQRQRGLRRREPGRRHLPARQQRLPHHARGARHRPGGGRAWPAADHPVLARRGAGPQRRIVRLGVAFARGYRSPAAAGPHRRKRATLAGQRDRYRRTCRGTVARVPGRFVRRAGVPADAGHARVRAFLRRSRRHAVRHPFAVRQQDQSGLGPRVAQALLSSVQLRTAGRGDRGQHRSVADHDAQLRTRRGGALPALDERQIAADPGPARRADVRHPLALGGRGGARIAAVPRRQEGRAATRAHGSRGPGRRGVSRSACLRRERRGGSRNTRPSADQPDDRRLPA